MSSADEITVHLDRLLAAASDEATRRHWERYLKGTATFRGVPMARIRTSVRRLWNEHRLGERPLDELLGLATRWFARADSEDKLAAVLLVAEHLAGRLDATHHGALAHHSRRATSPTGTSATGTPPRPCTPT